MRRARTVLGPLIDRVEGASGLDPAARALGKLARRAVGPGAVKDALSGTWQGHALHPALTDVVIGSLFSATILDVTGRDPGRSAARLIRVGLVAAVPTALTGVTDYGDSEEGSDAVRRAGLVHAAVNVTGLSLYAASLVARRRGARFVGVLLGLGGAGTLSAAAFLGGHLALTRGIGPDQTVFDPGPEEWTPAVEASQLRPGQVIRVVIADTPVALLRDGNRTFAIHDRCSHRGCSLSATGAVDGARIVCGCHGSTFDLYDGSIRRGPATAPQPTFDVRERDGMIELRRHARAPAPR
ncbi:MAG TPA: Rieske 2Fe-2S domain-containing protein [Pseudonocardiaceae bacterium]|nr:Rieske 2Fe-2S domain-containing protein [Pseudonocardiaceae bacterium]